MQLSKITNRESRPEERSTKTKSLFLTVDFIAQINEREINIKSTIFETSQTGCQGGEFLEYNEFISQLKMARGLCLLLIWAALILKVKSTCDVVDVETGRTLPCVFPFYITVHRGGPDIGHFAFNGCTK